MRLPRLRPDLAPLRDSRDFRLVVIGSFLSGLGAQATLVALPYQVYVQTRSALLVGLLGAVELVPLVAAALLGGGVADRIDRRKLLLLDQVGLVLTAAGLAVAAGSGIPPIGVLYALAALLAAFVSLESVVVSAIVPNLVDRSQLRGALALEYGLGTLTMVIGPALGGLVISALGLTWAYSIDAISCAAMVMTVLPVAPQPPHEVAPHERLRDSIVEGLRYVRGNQALLGSFAIDLVAMTFGMPRALFAVLSVGVYHAGAAGTGALYSATAAGATVAAMTTGWLPHARRLGRMVIWAVVVWGTTIAFAGLAHTLWLAAVAVCAGRRRRLGQRRLPHDDQPDGDAGADARPDVRGLLARRDRRPAAWRHRVRRGRRRDERPLLGVLGRRAVRDRRRCDRRRVPGAAPLRRRRLDRGAGDQHGVTRPSATGG